MAEERLPYWAQCNDCERWRELEHGETLNKEYNETFVCKKV